MGTEIDVQLAALKANDKVAIETFMKSISPKLRESVRSKMTPFLKARFDPHDFVQMVWQRVFRDIYFFQKFETINHAVGYLCIMAQDFVEKERIRMEETQKSSAVFEPLSSIMNSKREPVAKTRKPFEEEDFWAEVGLMTAELGKYERQVIELRMKQGLTFREIASLTKRKEHMARQVMEAFIPRLIERFSGLERHAAYLARIGHKLRKFMQPDC